MRRCLPSISQKLQRRELNGRLAPVPANLEERARRQKRTRGIRPASCCGLAAAQCSLKTTNYFCNQVFRRDSFMSNLLKAYIGDESIMGSVEFKCSRTRREWCRRHRDEHEETVTTPTA
jgi:hypothetical protein